MEDCHSNQCGCTAPLGDAQADLLPFNREPPAGDKPGPQAKGKVVFQPIDAYYSWAGLIAARLLRNDEMHFIRIACVLAAWLVPLLSAAADDPPIEELWKGWKAGDEKASSWCKSTWKTPASSSSAVAISVEIANLRTWAQG